MSRVSVWMVISASSLISPPGRCSIVLPLLIRTQDLACWPENSLSTFPLGPPRSARVSRRPRRASEIALALLALHRRGLVHVNQPAGAFRAAGFAQFGDDLVERGGV